MARGEAVRMAHAPPYAFRDDRSDRHGPDRLVRGIQLGLTSGELRPGGRKAEADARARSRAGKPDAAAVRLDDGSRDRKAQAGADVAARGLGSASIEGLERALPVR